VAIPGQSRIVQKGVEKLTKYAVLIFKVSRLWKTKKVLVIPIIVGALGSIPINLPKYILNLTSTFQSTVCIELYQF